MPPVTGQFPALEATSGLVQTGSMMSVAIVIIFATGWTALHPQAARTRVEHALRSLDRLPVLRLIQQRRPAPSGRIELPLHAAPEPSIVVTTESFDADARAQVTESAADERRDAPTSQYSTGVLWPSRPVSPLFRRTSPTPASSPPRALRDESQVIARLVVPVSAGVSGLGPITPTAVLACVRAPVPEEAVDPLVGVAIDGLRTTAAASEGGDLEEPAMQEPAKQSGLPSFPRTPATEPVLGQSDDVRGNEQRRDREAALVAA